MVERVNFEVSHQHRPRMVSVVAHPNIGLACRESTKHLKCSLVSVHGIVARLVNTAGKYQSLTRVRQKSLEITKVSSPRLVTKVTKKMGAPSNDLKL